jgi:hypothetical protein
MRCGTQVPRRPVERSRPFTTTSAVKAPSHGSAKSTLPPTLTAAATSSRRPGGACEGGGAKGVQPLALKGREKKPTSHALITGLRTGEPGLEVPWMTKTFLICDRRYWCAPPVSPAEAVWAVRCRCGQPAPGAPGHRHHHHHRHHRRRRDETTPGRYPRTRTCRPTRTRSTCKRGGGWRGLDSPRRAQANRVLAVNTA